MINEELESKVLLGVLWPFISTGVFAFHPWPRAALLLFFTFLCAVWCGSKIPMFLVNILVKMIKPCILNLPVVPLMLCNVTM